MSREVYLSLGTNLGDLVQNLRQAVELLGEKVGRVERESSVYYSAPWGFESENRFANIVVRLWTEMEPLQVLHETQEIERLMGRTHKSAGGVYTDRIIDIDILLFGNLQMDTPELTIPHPLMHLRDFVQVPLAEIQDK